MFSTGGTTVKRTLTVLLALGIAIAVAAPLIAHHSFSAEFDRTKRIELRGFVTKVEWTNPHVWFYINVPDPVTGKNTNWGVELGPPHGLQAGGWQRETMKLGDEVSLTGSRAKNWQQQSQCLGRRSFGQDGQEVWSPIE
jgi:hypothetical protein